MAVFQPLYHAGGLYSADTDRRTAAAIFDTNADGQSVSGVIPSFFGTNAMKVSANGTDRIITITPGMCVIPDQATQTIGDLGVYIAGISSDETLTLAANAGGSAVTDTIYAVVDETAFVVTSKVINGSNKATLTTDTAHNFNVGETVSVTGVDAIFDGSYIITEVTTTSPYTFSFAKTHASVSETPVTATVKSQEGSAYATYNVTTKILSSNVATLTLDSAHGIGVGRSITVSGVDGTFDGTYIVATVTTDTISYVIPRVVDNVNTTSVTQSAIARARVPFAIRAERTGGSTLADKTKLEIAKVSVPGSSATAIPVNNVTDTRSYVNVMGGVALYSSTATESAYYPTGSAGRMRYDTATSNLQIYDNTDASWKSIYNTTSNHHDSVATDGSALAIHHTLGGNEYQAAPGNHDHAAAYVAKSDGTVSSAPVGGGYVRNIYMSVSGPVSSDGTDGDVWLIYSE